MFYALITVTNIKPVNLATMKKKVFVSGGSKGIGLAIARKFYQEGFEVSICARGEAGLEAAKAEMPELHTFVCDLADKAAVKALASKLNEQFGALDVLVNNGGVFLPGLLHEEEDEVFERLIATNLNSVYYLTKGVLPMMMERKAGMIFNICSVASIRAYPGGSSYGISKHAMLGFSRGLREEMKSYDIRVTSVLPGAVYTDSWAGVEVEESRLMPVEDIADQVWMAYALSKRSVVEELVIRPLYGDL